MNINTFQIFIIKKFSFTITCFSSRLNFLFAIFFNSLLYFQFCLGQAEIITDFKKLVSFIINVILIKHFVLKKKKKIRTPGWNDNINLRSWVIIYYCPVVFPRHLILSKLKNLFSVAILFYFLWVILIYLIWMQTNIVQFGFILTINIVIITRKWRILVQIKKWKQTFYENLMTLKTLGCNKVEY